MNNMQRNAIVYSAVDPLARAVVQNLIRKGIKLLALDFDLTIVGVHTGGAWRGPIHQLAQHVRPCFKSVIEAALESGVLHVCIVTYSLQQGMIEDLLKYILPNSDTRRILVRTSLKDWLPKKNQPSKQSLGKQQHIAQVTTDLYNFCHAVIHPHEILLMDDDEENINIARHFGHTAFLVKEAVTLEDIYAFVEKLNESCVVAPPAPYVHPPESIFFAGHGSKHELPDHLTISSQKQRPSASVYLTSSPHSQVPTQRQSVAVSSSFAIPRPMVANETVRRTMPGEARARTEYGSAQPNSAATYIVMTNSR